MVFQLPKEHIFPDPSYADESGLIAVGGDLDPQRIYKAYQIGIFPWYSDGEPILWWTPNPRFVLYPTELKIAKSMRPMLNKKAYRLSLDEDFEQVIANCKTINRPGQDGTWISNEMKTAYIALHKNNIAHSVEVWDGEDLVGGLYGLVIGNTFSGESMFAKVSNASKYAFIRFVQFLKKLNLNLIDCQIETEYLQSFGARLINREDYIAALHLDEKNKQLENLNWSLAFKQFLSEV